MGRRQHPKIELNFEIEIATEYYQQGIMGESRRKTEYTLKIRARNTGRVYAEYVNSFIRLPVSIVPKIDLEYRGSIEENGQKYCELYEDNTVRDVIDVDFTLGSAINKYGPSRFDPILPGLSRTWSVKLCDDFVETALDGLVIKWSTYADNARASGGEIEVSDIARVDRRKS